MGSAYGSELCLPTDSAQCSPCIRTYARVYTRSVDVGFSALCILSPNWLIICSICIGRRLAAAAAAMLFFLFHASFLSLPNDTNHLLMRCIGYIRLNAHARTIHMYGIPWWWRRVFLTGHHLAHRRRMHGIFKSRKLSNLICIYTYI